MTELEEFKMKDKIKTILAFGIVLILVVTGFILDKSDQTTDVFPNENTMISLYGEEHGHKKCYDIELKEWREIKDTVIFLWNCHIIVPSF